MRQTTVHAHTAAPVLVLKIAPMVWHNASRDKRELSVCRELGAEALVMAKGDKTGAREVVDGFSVYRCSTRPLGAGVPVCLNRVISLFTWAHEARKLRPDVISGHDLGGLLIGYLSNWWLPKDKKALLIYDSHEFELGRNTGKRRRTRSRLALIKWLEGFLMKRCAFTIAVSNAIAEELRRVHCLQGTVPIVVARSMPEKWTLDQTVISRQRKAFCAALNVPEDTFLLMYSGALMMNRGIENLLRVVVDTQKTAAVILGYGEENYISEIKGLCDDWNIADRVLFHEAVPMKVLWQYIGAADVGMVIHPPVTRSLYLTIPNRLCENVQALTPVIVSDFPEPGGLTREYGIGITVDPESVEELIAAVERLRDDKAFYAQCKENLVRAKEELCWEREKETLKAAYRGLFAKTAEAGGESAASEKLEMGK